MKWVDEKKIIELRKFKQYLKDSILKPYLIHVEFEILNVLTQLKLDKIIEKIYTSKGFNFNYLIESTEKFLYRIKNLIKALEI